MYCLQSSFVCVFLLKYIASTLGTVPNLTISVTHVSVMAVGLSCSISGGQVELLQFQGKVPIGDEFENIASISVINKTCESKSAVKVNCSCLKENKVVCIIPVHPNKTDNSWKCSTVKFGLIFGSNIVNTSGEIRDNKDIVANNNIFSTTEDTTISTKARSSSDSGIVLICVALVILLGVASVAVRHRRRIRYRFTRARSGFGNNDGTKQSPARRGSVSVNVYNTYVFAKSVDDEPEPFAEPSQPDSCHSLPRGLHSEINSVADIEDIVIVSSLEGDQNDDQDAGYAEIECRAEPFANNDFESNPDSLVTEFDMDDLQYAAGGRVWFAEINTP